MKLCYNVDINVDPLVVKWLDARFRKPNGIYEMKDSCWYGLVSMALCQSAKAKRESVLPEKYRRFSPVKIRITEYDFYHYGWEVNATQEIRLSRLLKRVIEDEILRNAAIMRARYDMPLSQAINAITVFYNLTEDDVKFETLRKTYRRNYTGMEEEYRALDCAALTDFGKDERTDAAKQLRLRQKAGNPGQLDMFEEYRKPTIWKN